MRLLLLSAAIAAAALAQQGPNVRVTYAVDGTAKKAFLSYNNASGAVEQKTVPLPWRLEFEAPEDRVFSIWAQSKNRSKTINSTLSCDGKIKQEAKSSGSYAVALAKSSCK